MFVDWCEYFDDFVVGWVCVYVFEFGVVVVDGLGIWFVVVWFVVGFGDFGVGVVILVVGFEIEGVGRFGVIVEEIGVFFDEFGVELFGE